MKVYRWITQVSPSLPGWNGAQTESLHSVLSSRSRRKIFLVLCNESLGQIEFYISMFQACKGLLRYTILRAKTHQKRIKTSILAFKNLLAVAGSCCSPSLTRRRASGTFIGSSRSRIREVSTSSRCSSGHSLFMEMLTSLPQKHI